MLKVLYWRNLLKNYYFDSKNRTRNVFTTFFAKHYEMSSCTCDLHILSSPLPYLLSSECCRTECDSPTYDYTPYYSQVYDLVCKNISTGPFVKSYISASNKTDFNDWIITGNKFCKPWARGFSHEDFNKLQPNSWNYMNAGCKFGTVFALTLLFLISILIIFLNGLVVFIVLGDRRFHTAWGVYKFSLAVSDLLVGIIICPMVVYREIFSVTASWPWRSIGQFPSSNDMNSQAFYDTIGVFMFLSLSSSIFTLTIASIDRWFALTRPFIYNKLNTMRTSYIGVIIIWSLSLQGSEFNFLNDFEKKLN